MKIEAKTLIPVENPLPESISEIKALMLDLWYVLLKLKTTETEYSELIKKFVKSEVAKATHKEILKECKLIKTEEEFKAILFALSNTFYSIEWDEQGCYRSSAGSIVQYYNYEEGKGYEIYGNFEREDIEKLIDITRIFKKRVIKETPITTKEDNSMGIERFIVETSEEEIKE